MFPEICHIVNWELELLKQHELFILRFYRLKQNDYIELIIYF